MVYLHKMFHLILDTFFVAIFPKERQLIINFFTQAYTAE